MFWGCFLKCIYLFIIIIDLFIWLSFFFFIKLKNMPGYRSSDLNWKWVQQIVLLLSFKPFSPAETFPDVKCHSVICFQSASLQSLSVWISIMFLICDISSGQTAWTLESNSYSDNKVTTEQPVWFLAEQIISSQKLGWMLQWLWLYCWTVLFFLC